MNDSTATHVATCHPFIATPGIRKRRDLARQAKKRRDPGERVMIETLVRDVRAAIAGFEPSADLELAAWFGTADRLAQIHPSGVLELLGSDSVDSIAFVSAVGPPSYWPAVEAQAYQDALAAFKRDRGAPDKLALAATALVNAARQREATWSAEEWEYRMVAAIVAWIYWDDEPGSRPQR